jgi:S-adenosylmethionine decarboxylase
MEVGYHLIADLECGDSTLLKTMEEMKKIVEEAVLKGNLTKISSDYHQFQPFGVSGVVLLAESHLSFHSFPEYNLLTLDIYTCGENREERVNVAYEYIVNSLNATEIKKWVLVRG